MVHFGEFLKTWRLRSNSVTRQVSFNRSKIGGKCQNWKIQMRHFGRLLATVLKQALMNICFMKQKKKTRKKWFLTKDGPKNLQIEMHCVLSFLCLKKRRISMGPKLGLISVSAFPKTSTAFTNETLKSNHKFFSCNFEMVFEAFLVFEWFVHLFRVCICIMNIWSHGKACIWRAKMLSILL